MNDKYLNPEKKTTINLEVDMLSKLPLYPENNRTRVSANKNIFAVPLSLCLCW